MLGTLEAIENLLNAGGVNYSVFLRGYLTALSENASLETVVSAAVGASVALEGVRAVSSAEVITEIKTALCYAGDKGAGPAAQAIQSNDFRALLSTLVTEVDALAHNAPAIFQFGILRGHPACPVFWDFAFAFIGDTDAAILVGSASD